MSQPTKQKPESDFQWPPATQKSVANPYSKLEEASRIYLNPTLTQIVEEVDLTACCYYRLKKYPKGTSEFWALLREREFDQMEIFLQEELPDPYLLANVRLARQVQDVDYIHYLEEKQPLSKLHLKVTAKQHLVPPEILQTLGLPSDEPVSTAQLKMAMHAYIAEQDLQEKRQVVLDPVLIQLVSLESEDQSTLMQSPPLSFQPGKPVSYWDLWAAFKLKFLDKM